MGKQREVVDTDLGTFEQDGDGWMCYFGYDGRDIELYVGDSMGAPDQAQAGCLRTLVPRLSVHESECRREVSSIDEHDLGGVLFEDGCDFVLAFDWGNGEWGQTVFVKMASGKVIKSYTVSD